MSDKLHQLLIQQLNLVDGPTLWVIDENLSPAELQAIHPHPHLVAITNRYDVQQSLRQADIQVTLNDFDFSIWPKNSFVKIIYRVSKERALVHHCINHAFSLLQTEGQLLLLGGKQDGIKTNAKSAATVFGSKAHSKKHGIHYLVTVQKSAAAASGADRNWLDSNDYSNLRLCHSDDMEFLSKPGVFGWNKVDRGSALLVEQTRELFSSAQQSEPPEVLDLGCGYGYILLATGDLPFGSRTATDNNATAVTAAAANFARAELTVQVSLDDCGAQLKQSFDLILCNPPFHQGFASSRDLTEKFLQQIRRLLAKEGQALLVVNQFIPLEKIAAEWFGSVETLCSTESFKVVALKYAKTKKR
jgi:16S rRNA (guanine1207-N2)-methyltransferase